MMMAKKRMKMNGSDVGGIIRTFGREKQSKPITRKDF